MLPKRNIILTISLCFIFYYIVIYDIYIITEKCTLVKFCQFSLVIINLMCLCTILKKDPGQATTGQQRGRVNINFVGDNVLYTRKIPAQGSSFNNGFFNDDFCEKCYVIEQESISHCRYCDVCLINRDHHCAWFNKCIAYKNFNIFLSFIISLSVSALLIVSDTFRIFSAKVLVELNLLQIFVVIVTMLLSMSLFVLSSILSLQYLFSLILGIKTKKLLRGDWEWQSVRFFKCFRRKGLVEILELDE